MNQQPNLSRAVTPAEPSKAGAMELADIKAVSAGGVIIVPQSLGEIIEFSKLMAGSGVAVRKHMRGNPGACFSIAMQAFRWGMDPFQVANKSFEVNDQIAYEAQMIAAVINKNAPIKDRPTYAYSGNGLSRRCTVTVVTTSGQSLSYESPEIANIKPQNSPLWKSDPDQQLGYYSIRALARRHFPDILLGVYDPEEAESMSDVTPAAPAFAQPIDVRPAKAKATDALDRLQSRRQKVKTVEHDHVSSDGDVSSDKIEAGEVSAEAVAHDDDGVVPDDPGIVDESSMPAEAAAEWRDRGKWYPAFQWIEQQAEMLPPPVLAAILIRHEDVLVAAMKRSDEGAARVAALKQKAGLE